jgi:ribonuclease HI
MIIYTDGACKNNQNKNINIRKGGYGVFFGDNDNDNPKIENISAKLEGPKITNQVAELTACIKAIEKLMENKIIIATHNATHNNNNNIVAMQQIDQKGHIIIKTDSMYTINCIDNWFDGWKKRGWKKADGKPVDNLELIQKLHEYKTLYNVKFIHVRAHKSEPSKDDERYADWYGNMMADKLATNGCTL